MKMEKVSGAKSGGKLASKITGESLDGAVVLEEVISWDCLNSRVAPCLLYGRHCCCVMETVVKMGVIITKLAFSALQNVGGCELGRSYGKLAPSSSLSLPSGQGIGSWVFSFPFRIANVQISWDNN